MCVCVCVCVVHMCRYTFEYGERCKSIYQTVIGYLRGTGLEELMGKEVGSINKSLLMTRFV